MHRGSRSPEDTLQPASVDIRLDRQFRVFRNHRDAYIDIRESTEGLTEMETIKDDEPFVLHPGEFVRGSTLERVTLGDDIIVASRGQIITRPTTAWDSRRAYSPSDYSPSRAGVRGDA